MYTYTHIYIDAHVYIYIYIYDSIWIYTYGSPICIHLYVHVYVLRRGDQELRALALRSRAINGEAKKFDGHSWGPEIPY